MRKIKGGVFLSLDGVMQAPGGPTEDWTGGFEQGGWLTGFFDETVGEEIGRLFTPPYDLLLGRRTYDIFAAHWPYATGDDAPMGEALTSAAKYVLTQGTQSFAWANSHRLVDLDAVAALKEGGGPDLLIQGSSTLYPALMKRGLLDRLTIFTFPAVLGRGKRPFGDTTPAGALKMVEHKVSPGGVVIATYEPAGAISIGSFAMGDAAPPEQERQRRMREGSW